jgi:hypothetical protein
MPTEHHLFQDKTQKDLHTLQVDIMPAYDQTLFENYKVEIVLPEGATDIHIEIPSSCGISEENMSIDRFFGTLDYFGRPRVTITKTNAVHDLCDNMMSVQYRYSNSQLL